MKVRYERAGGGCGTAWIVHYTEQGKSDAQVFVAYDEGFEEEILVQWSGQAWLEF